MSRKPVEGNLKHEEVSPTASTLGNEKFGPSGAMNYDVTVVTSVGAQIVETVNASTGDEAATKAASKYPGSKVVYVGPTPQVAA